ncbi:MAG: hypothetical protein M3M93_03760, partial [Actinomycetota bacterium]|nr:hypothetical protein [Actinomycetota bacterium]
MNDSIEKRYVKPTPSLAKGCVRKPSGRVAGVLRGVDAAGIFLGAGSIEIPEGTTPHEWLDREERRAVVVAG